jgi:tripartite-type tricarboxylate transporter receptor subunit TctC
MSQIVPMCVDCASAWIGLDQYLVAFAPAGTPPEIVAKLNAEVVRLLHTAEMRERLALLGAEPIGNKPEEFAAFIKTEIPKYAKVVKASGAKVD